MKRAPRFAVIKDVVADGSVRIYDQTNLFGCTIGTGTKIDAFVYIEEDVRIGRQCKIRPFVFIPAGIRIGDRVFVGPGVSFTNDKHPKVSGRWKPEVTIVEDDVSIGAGAIILPGITIGAGAVVGAGSVVTRDVDGGELVVGNPARIVRKRSPK